MKTLINLVNIALISPLLIAPAYADQHFGIEKNDYKLCNEKRYNGVERNPQHLYFQTPSGGEHVQVSVNNKIILTNVRGNFSASIANILQEEPDTLTIELKRRSQRDPFFTQTLTFDDEGKIKASTPSLEGATSCYQVGSSERYDTFSAVYVIKG